MFKAGVDAVSKVIIDTLFNIAFFFDNIVYTFIPKLYKLIIYLANVDLFNGNSAVKALLNRVYILVGVFMLFKLAFSILRYIVDPSAFTDQNKGFTNLVKRILIALVLLVSINPIFDKIYEIQNIIISKNIVSNLILGSNSSSDVTIDEASTDVQFLIFGPFFSINPIGSLNVCASDPDSGYPLSNIIGTTDMALKDDGECLKNLADAMDASSNAKASGVTIDDFFDINQRDFSSLGVLISVEEPDTGGRVVNYLPVFSTLCGGYLVFLLLSFCIDIGGRAIKLLFLQVLSPIAIISSVDPTESTQGGKLKEWGKECLVTFAGLFLRLAVVYLVIQMVKVITAKLFDDTNLYYSGFTPDSSLNIFVYIFLILGAFQVAKKIPDLIGQAFGVKLSGDLQLNPFKALRENAGVGLGLAGLGIGATAVASGAANTLAGIVEGKGVIGTAGSAIGGFFGGGYRSLRGAMNGEKGMKNFSNSFGSAMFARQQRDDLNRQGSTWQGRLMADVNRHLGLMNAAQRQELDYARDENVLNDRQSRIESEKREVARLKDNMTRDFRDYSSAMSSINDIIGNDTSVKNAQAKYDEAIRTGVGEEAAKKALDRAKRNTWEALQTGSTPYGASNQSLVQTYLDRINQLRESNDTIQSFAPVTDFEGNFDKSSMYASQNEVSRIDYQFSIGIERTQSDIESQISREKAELEATKSTAEWKANELDNSSRGVKSPQPEGWKPSGEISGAYGPQYGPGVWGHRGGNNGRRP